MNIQDDQIQSITKKGIAFIDNEDKQHFIDFEECYQEMLEIWNHPNVRKLNMQLRYQDQYFKLVDTLKSKKVVGWLAPNGGWLPFDVSHEPKVSIGNIQINFANMKDYIAFREKVLIRGFHFILGMFDVV